MTVNVCAKMCVSECVCAAFLPSLKAWKHNYALTQRHRPAFHMTHWAPVFGHKSTAAGVEVAPHKHGSMLETGGWVLRLHYPALKCSCLHGSRTVRHSVCVCDSDDVRMAHDGSYCCCCLPLFSLLYWKSWKSTDYNKKSQNKKHFGILCTFHNLLHLLPPPQLTRYIWQHWLLTTNEQKGRFRLNLQIQTNSPKNIYTGVPVTTVTHGKTVVQWLCNICADIFLWVNLRSTNHCLFKDVCRHMEAINRFLKALKVPE